MRVAIMQPTYLPWAGYFGLMQAVDLFILLDTVQFARRSWQQRNQIKTANGPLWLTVPVVSKGKREQIISSVEIDYSQKFPKNHIGSLVANYKQSVFFEAYSQGLLDIIDSGKKYLSSLTIEAILHIKDILKIQTPVRLASEFAANGAKANLLVALCERVGASQYVSPPGSKVYLDESTAFAEKNISVHYYSFTHPQYSQRFGEFLPNMSIVDLVFNCGTDSLPMIDQGSLNS